MSARPLGPGPSRRRKFQPLLGSWKVLEVPRKQLGGNAGLG